jgi:hypothetical protein
MEKISMKSLCHISIMPQFYFWVKTRNDDVFRACFEIHNSLIVIFYEVRDLKLHCFKNVAGQH